MSRIAENSFDGLMTAGAGGRILTANRSATRLFAGGEAGLAGAMTSELLPQLPPLAGLAAAGRPVETVGRCRDGQPFDAELAVTALHEPGESVHILVVRDVTARRRAERQARALQRRLTDAIDSLQDGFALWDRADRLIACNDRFAAIQRTLGGTAMLGRTFEENLAGALPVEAKDPGEGATGTDAALREEAPRTGDARRRLHREGGSREFHLGGGAWVLATEKRTSEGGTVSLCIDISLLKEREFDLVKAARHIEAQAMDIVRFAAMLEDTRREAVEAAEAAEAANRAKSAFLGMVSHELRTPLNAINGFAEIMSGEMMGPLPPRYRDYARAIQQSGERLLNTINMILDLTRIEGGAFDPDARDCDIGAALGAELALLRPRAAAAGVALHERLDGDLPTIRGDDRLLSQIFGNVMSNAVKFTPAGGAVTVSAGPADRDGRAGVAVSVEDTGIGIAEEDMERALSLFGQIDTSLARRYEGTGLGLPIARRATEVLEGSLSLASTLGEGTRVDIWLPCLRSLARPGAGGE
jgi:two-component system cell cycle sensor histidine kinase PleC